MNAITKKFLSVVGYGFTFNQDNDLQMVKDSNNFLDSLSHQERVNLIEGLDTVLEGNRTIKNRS